MKSPRTFWKWFVLFVLAVLVYRNDYSIQLQFATYISETSLYFSRSYLIGREYESEHEDEIKDRRQYGVDGYVPSFDYYLLLHF